MDLRVYHLTPACFTDVNYFQDKKLLAMVACLNVALFGDIPGSMDGPGDLEKWRESNYTQGHFEVNTGSKEDVNTIKNTNIYFTGCDIATLFERYYLAMQILSDDPSLLDPDQQLGADGEFDTQCSLHYWAGRQATSFGGGGEPLTPNQLREEAGLLFGKCAFALCAPGTCLTLGINARQRFDGENLTIPHDSSAHAEFEKFIHSESQKAFDTVKNLFENLQDINSDSYVRTPVTFDLGLMVTSALEGGVWLPVMKESAKVIKKAMLNRGLTDPEEEEENEDDAVGLDEETVLQAQGDGFWTEGEGPVAEEEEGADEVALAEQRQALQFANIEQIARKKNMTKHRKHGHKELGTVHGGGVNVRPEQDETGAIDLRFAMQAPVASGQIYEKAARVEGMDKCRKRKDELCQLLPHLLNLSRIPGNVGAYSVEASVSQKIVKKQWARVEEMLQYHAFKTESMSLVLNRPVRFEFMVTPNYQAGVAFRFPREVGMLSCLKMYDRTEVRNWDFELLNTNFTVANDCIKAAAPQGGEVVAAGIGLLPPAAKAKVIYCVEMVLMHFDALFGCQGNIASEIWKSIDQSNRHKARLLNCRPFLRRRRREQARTGLQPPPLPELVHHIHIPDSLRVLVEVGNERMIGINPLVLKLGGLGGGASAQGGLTLPDHISHFNINFNTATSFYNFVDRTVMRAYSNQDNITEIEGWQSCMHRILLEATVEEDELGDVIFSVLSVPEWDALAILTKEKRVAMLTKMMKVLVSCSCYYTWKSLIKFEAYGKVRGDPNAPFSAVEFAEHPLTLEMISDLSEVRRDHKFAKLTPRAAGEGSDSTIRNHCKPELFPFALYFHVFHEQTNPTPVQCCTPSRSCKAYVSSPLRNT
jgi:hypothetical protein